MSRKRRAQSQQTRPARSRAAWILVAAILTAIAAYWPAMRAPYEFDDATSIPGNPTIRTLRPAEALDPPPNTSVSGRPVVNYSFALNNAINRWLGVDERPDPLGPNKTVGYHAGNVLLHVFCGLLLFGTLRRTLAASDYGPAGSDVVAAVAASLWLLHPLNSEAVNYLVQRTELMVSVFYVAVLYSWIRAWDATTHARSRYWRLLAVGLCLLGMGSKEVMITAPFMVVAYDFTFRSSSSRTLAASRERVAFYAALAATSAWAVVSIANGARGGTVGLGAGIPWYSYLYTQGWAIARYLLLVVFPVHLALDYGQHPVAGWAAAVGSLVVAALLVTTIVVWLRGSVSKRRIAFAGVWFFVLLAPSSSVVPIATEIAAERRVYLASAAPMVLLVLAALSAISRLTRRSTEHARRLNLQLGIGTVAIALLLAAGTFARSRLYAEPEALWRDAVAARPDNPRAYDNLAATLFYRDPPRLAEADSLYRKAISLDSTYAHAWTGLASVAVDENRLDDAQTALERVLRIAPGYSDAVDHLGRLLLRRGRPDQAIPYLEQFARAYPGDNSLALLGGAYLQVGRLADATRSFEQALTLNPSRSDVLRNLGGLYVELNRGRDALPLLERLAADPTRRPIDLGLLGIAYGEVGRASDALRLADAAAESAPADPAVLLLAGRGFELAGELELAKQAFSEALRLRPNDPEATARLRALGRRM